MCENKDTALTVQSEQLNEVMAKPTGGFIESFRAEITRNLLVSLGTFVKLQKII